MSNLYEWYVVQNDVNELELHVFNQYGDYIYYEELSTEDPLFCEDRGVIPLVFKIIERKNPRLCLKNYSIYDNRNDFLNKSLYTNDKCELLMMKKLNSPEDTFQMNVNGKNYTLNIKENKNEVN